MPGCSGGPADAIDGAPTSEEFKDVPSVDDLPQLQWAQTATEAPGESEAAVRAGPPEVPADFPPRPDAAAPTSASTFPTMSAEEVEFVAEFDHDGLGFSVGADNPPVYSFTALNEYYDQFGRATAVGDFNDDGFDDLVVGAPFESVGSRVSAGHVFVYKGSAAGLSAWRRFGQSGLGGDEHFDRFGWALAVGDFNGDGVDDLATSAPWEAPSSDPSSGYVFVYTGTGAENSPLTAWRAYSQETLGLGTNEKGDRFGYALSAGNYNGDAYDDLAIGAPGEAPSGSPRSGAVFVASGGASGLTGKQLITQSGASTMNAEERFGSSLASGNFFDTDFCVTPAVGGCDDLAIGCFNDHLVQQSGSVFIYEGQWGPGNLDFRQKLTQWTFNEMDDDFGWALAAADFDGNGWADLAVGTPGENRDEGRVYVFVSDGNELDKGVSLSQQFGGVEQGDRFGASLAAGEISGNSRADLLVASPRAIDGTRTGRVEMYLGSSTQTLTSWTDLDASTLGIAGGDNNYGHTVAFGNFTGGTWGDSVVGAPNEFVSEPNVGAAYLFTTPWGTPSARITQAAE